MLRTSPQRRAFLLACLSLAWSSRACGQTAAEIKRVGEFYRKSDGFSGNIVVVREGQIVANLTYGKASRELGVANSLSTRFAIGSISKQFTAAGILLLQEQGALKTTDSLAQHYAATPSQWKDVTLQQLLQHTSGIPDGLNVWGPAGKSLGEPTPQQIVESAGSKPLDFAPGTRYEYNNMGYLLLGLVIEKESGQSLKDFLQSRFFTPLQMINTGLATSNEMIPHIATGYVPYDKGVEVASPVPFSSVFAAGAIYSTGEDLAKWVFALHGGRVLKSASYEEMTKENPFHYGYGISIAQQSGKTDYWHYGQVAGFSSQLDYFPESKTAIILLSNQLSHKVSPGESGIETDLMRLATEKHAVIRSMGRERHVAEGDLRKYEGTYTAADPNTLPVTVEERGGHLMFTPRGKRGSTLAARSEDEFYVKEWSGEVRFQRSVDGRWTLNLLNLSDQTMLTMKKSEGSIPGSLP